MTTETTKTGLEAIIEELWQPSPEDAGLISYINGTPGLLSLLYDLDLMPEQVRNGQDRKRMLLLAAWWKDWEESGKVLWKEAAPPGV